MDTTSPLDAARRVNESLLEMLPVRAVSLEIPDELSTRPIRAPEEFFYQAPVADSIERIVCQLGPRPLVIACLFWPNVRRRTLDTEVDLAFARFIIHVLGYQIGRYLEPSAPLRALSRREREVAALLHLQDREILESLHIEKSTLETHRKQIYRKLGVHKRDEALRSISQGLRWTPCHGELFTESSLVATALGGSVEKMG